MIVARFLFGFALILAGSLVSAQTAPEPKSKIEELAKAEELLRKGKGDEAFKLIQDAVKKNPTLLPARLLMAKLCLALNQQQAARANLEMALTENPDHPEILLTNGGVALAEGRLTEVILNCKAALTHASAERWTADEKKRFQREARAGLSAAFEARKDWSSARTELTLWLEIEPKNAAVRQRLARCLVNIGKSDDAFLELKTAHAEDPTQEPPELTMGRFATQKEDSVAAEEWFEKAITKHAKNPKVHQAYGGWLLDIGKAEAAKVHIETGAQIDPKSRETLGLKGLLARYQRNFAEAEKLFDEIHRENPGDFFSSNQLALVLAEQNDAKAQKRAIQLAEVNARQYNRSPEALATLGWVFFKSGRLEEADQVMGTVGTVGQVSADTAFYMANLLRSRDKIDDAITLLEKAVAAKSVFVNRKTAETMLAELKTKQGKK